MPAVFPNSYGDIEGTPIGVTTPSTGTFTTLSDLGGGTFGSNSSTGETVSINTAAGNTRLITFQTAGSNRWGLTTNNTAESGSNVGSDFALNRYNDAGTLVDTPIAVNRSAGTITLGTATNVNATLTVGSNSNAQAIFLNGPATSSRTIRMLTGGVSRWAINANGTAEGGSNAGSDLDIVTYNDAGAALINPAVRITRSTGNVTLNAGVSFGSTLASSTTDLTKHIALFSTNYGLNITSSRLNISVNTGASIMGVVGGSDAFQFTSTGLNNTAVGASTASTGAFTSLSTSSTFSALTTFSQFGANASSSQTVWMNSAAGGNRVHSFTTAGSTRWNVGANNTAEGGSNAGSDYIINAYNDAGSFLSTPITITRSSGAISLAGSTTVSNTLQVGTSSTAQAFLMNGPAASNRTISLRTATVERWRLQANNTAEGGSNAGSDLDLISFDDSGTAISNPLLRITRSTGNIVINSNTTIQNALTVGSNSAASILLTNGPAGVGRPLEWRTANVQRWRLQANATAEGGSNAGSDLDLISYNDAGSALVNPAIRITRSTGLATFFVGAQVTPTVATSAGSGAMFNLGDAVSANNDPFLYSYIVGSSSGAISSIGLNHYFSTGAASTRPNTSKNGWWFQHDNRNATTDGALVLRIISSAGSAATAVTFQTDGSMVQTNGGISTTTLAASGTVSGTGFTNYLASPPAIGGTTPASGSFTQVIAGTNGSAGNMYINGPANSNIGYRFQAAGVMRWILYNSGAESGSNTGDDFYIGRYNDAGTLIDQPLSILRSTGVVSAPQGFSTTGNYYCGGNFTPGLGGGTGGIVCRQGSSGTVGGNVYNIYWSGAAASLYIDGSNLGQFSFVSDARRKHSISPMPDGALDRIKHLTPVRFRWKEEGIFKDIDQEEGLLAQDVMQVIPSAVAKDDADEDGTMSLKPLALITTLVKAVQELMARVEVLEAAQTA